MNKLLFAMLFTSTIAILPNQGQAAMISMDPGDANSVLERRGADDAQPRQEDRQQDRRQDRQQDRQQDRRQDRRQDRGHDDRF